MLHGRRQFLNIATQVAQTMWPTLSYRSLSLINEKGISITDTDGTDYWLLYNAELNCIKVYIRQGGKKIGELSHKLGSISIANLIDEIRSKPNESHSPFAVLLNL